MKLIAETAFHHDGDYEFLNNLVEEILESEADIIKLHLLIDLDKYMHKSHAAYDYLAERIFSVEKWKSALDKVSSSSKELMLLLNDMDAVDLAIGYNPKFVEVHSVALNNFELLKYIDTKFPIDTKIVLGVGGSTLYEIENAISQFTNRKIVLMFGFQNYPTRYEDVNFNKMKRIMNAYPEFEFGYADHTAWDMEQNVLITLMGASLGMDYIEKHCTTHYGEDRTDSSAAVSFEQLSQIKQGMQVLQACHGNGNLSLNSAEKSYSALGSMKQIAIFNDDIKSGQNFNLSMVEFLRYGDNNGISQAATWDLVGKQIVKGAKRGDVVNYSYFEA